MKKSMLLIAFAFFANCSSVICQTTAVEPFKIEFTSIQTIRGYGTGGGSVMPKRGYKCILVKLKLTNMTDQDAQVELGEFRLLDTASKTAYLPQAVMANTVFTFGARSNKKVKPGDQIERNVYYFVKRETAVKYFSYHDDLYVKD